MESMLSQIRQGSAKTEFSAAGKSDEQLLREIQAVQIERLKRTLDGGAEKRNTGNTRK